MKTYTIKNSAIMHNGKLFPEGSTIDLEDKEAESLSDFLVTLSGVEGSGTSQVDVSPNIKKELKSKNKSRSK